MKELKGFDGHIILYCKNHYKSPEGFFAGLRMIWSVRCGYDYNKKDSGIDRYIANRLYKILQELLPERMQYLHERIHEEINYDWRYKDSTAIEKLIYIYVSEIANIQIKNKISDKKWITLIKLPKPNKRVFNRILRGNGKYDDYYLIEPKS